MARSALHSVGIVHAVRTFKRRTCRILVYHRFPKDRSHLIAQCEHIRRHYQPVSMRQVAEALGSRAPLPHNAIAITVDDGFRDFLLHAHPVLSNYEIPATVFVVTDFIDRCSWPWFSQIEYMIERISARSLQFLGREFAIGGDRMRAAVKVTEALKRLPNFARIGQLEVLRRLLGVELPECPPPEYEPLNWDDVRALAAEGVEFGAHTRTHPVLSSLSDRAELHQEIAGSKQRLDEQLGYPTLHFCYPFGTWSDFNDQTVAIIRRTGFATAVTAESGFNNARTDPFRLRRLGVTPTLPERRFIELLAGVRKY